MRLRFGDVGVPSAPSCLYFSMIAPFQALPVASLVWYQGEVRLRGAGRAARDLVWGAAPLSLPIPDMFAGTIVLSPGILYPIWRLMIIGAGLAVALILYLLVSRTRVGMLVRAGATHARIVSALGIDIRRLFMIVFGFGTMLAAFAGVMIAPILSVEPGMGDSVLILAFVVIVIGGIGSMRGAFIAALLIGLVDTLGRSFSIDILRLIMPPSPARTVGPAIASMLIYVLMALVLYFRPAGLFPAKGR